MALKREIQEPTKLDKQIPDLQQTQKELPSAEMMLRQLPKVGNPENVVMIGGQPVEIKPTKLKYQRNKTATFYRIMELYPLTDILAMDEGQFGDGRDGDKAVMDWLIAATDDEQMILENYDELDTGTIEKILQIFKRVNKITQKDEKLKNLEKDRKGAE